MKHAVFTVSAVLVLGLSSIVSASAAERPSRYTSFGSQTVEAARPVTNEFRAPSQIGCRMSSAAEGNANQPTLDVMQYGQTSGGSRC